MGSSYSSDTFVTVFTSKGVKEEMLTVKIPILTKIERKLQGNNQLFASYDLKIHPSIQSLPKGFTIVQF